MEKSNTHKKDKPIVFIINSLYPGRAEWLLVSDINELKKRGVLVKLITLKKEKESLSIAHECKIEKENWEIINFRSFLDLSSWIKIVSLIVRWRPEAVFTYLWYANTIGRIAAKLAGVKKMFSFELSVYDKLKSSRQFKVDRMLARVTNKIIAVSTEVKSSLIANGIAGDKITTIFNAINLDRYKNIISKNRNDFGLKKEDFVFLFIGRLTAQKGADVLLKAFAKLQKGFLMIVGEGEDRIFLEKQVNDLDIAGRTKFLGARYDIPELFTLADCFVLPSRWEGLPMIVLEAMAAQKPIIVSDLKSYRGVLENNKNCLMVGIEDYIQLAQAMESIMAQESLRSKIVEESQKTIGEFSIEKHVDRMLSLTNSVGI